MDYNYEDTSAFEPTPEHVNPENTIPEIVPPAIPSPEATPEVTPAVTTEANAVNTSTTNIDLTAQPKPALKPFEAIALVLIACSLIYWGLGIKHVKKPTIKPAHKVVAVAKKETPKAVIKITQTITPQQQRGNNVSRRTRVERTDPAWKKWGPKQ
jgi:hypothetical protein